MSATAEEARFVFEQWHRRIEARDGEALAALYRDDAVLESPLVLRVLDDTTKGIIQGRQELDQFLREITKRRPGKEELASLYRTGAYMFDGKMLIWEYPRQTPDGDQLDLVEVIELGGPLIAYHRIYWGWRGVEHVITNAVDKAVR